MCNPLRHAAERTQTVEAAAADHHKVGLVRSSNQGGFSLLRASHVRPPSYRACTLVSSAIEALSEIAGLRLPLFPYRGDQLLLVASCRHGRPYDHNRAGCVVRHLLADGTEQQTLEAAAPAGTDDQ